MRAAFFDVDGTLTTTRVWQGIMDYYKVHRLRRGTHFAFLAYHYPIYALHSLNLISQTAFRRPWAAHLGWYFRQTGMEDAGQIWDWIVLQYVNKFWREDVRRILESHRDGGDLVVLVSGGPLPLLKRIAAELGVEHAVGTAFEVQEGRYTGRTTGPVCLNENKARLTQDYLGEHGFEIDFERSYAYADSISDRGLLELVGCAVAVYPDEELRLLALERDWQVFPENA